MRFKALLSLAGTMTIASFAHAGTITVLDISMNEPLQPHIDNYHVGISAYASGRKFGLDVSVSPTTFLTGPYDHGGNASVVGTANVRVRWTPSYVGEPKPLGVPCQWSVKQSNGAYISSYVLSLFGSSSFCSAFIGSLPDPAGCNVNYTWTLPNLSTVINNAPPTTHNVTHGELMFHEENGEWIGVGGIGITNGVSFSTFAGLNERICLTAYSSIEFTLTSVGGHPVVP
jgi:hypothetical protein